MFIFNILGFLFHFSKSVKSYVWASIIRLYNRWLLIAQIDVIQGIIWSLFIIVVLFHLPSVGFEF